MFRFRGLALGIVGSLSILALAVFFASPGAAAPPADGDWTITGLESYSDQVITIANNSNEWGNVTVAIGGDLRLDNVTLVLPLYSTFWVQGNADVRNSLLQGNPYRILINGSVVFDHNTIYNATFFGGTTVNSTNALIEYNTWDCGGSSSGTIHLRQPISFNHNTMRQACLVSYELAPIAVDMTVEFGWNTFYDTGSGNQLTFNGVAHTGLVVFDIHHMDLFGGGWSIVLDATVPNTTFNIHESYFANTSIATIRVDNFDGQLHIWNTTFSNVYRAARFGGVTGGQLVATMDNVTVINASYSILAEYGTWIIRNSSFSGAFPQFEAGPNGRIFIYDSVDTPFSATASGANATVEHFALLNVLGASWQGSVPFQGDLLSLRNPAGQTQLTVDPSTWTPSYIPWWGVYNNAPNVDGRDLRPVVVDGQRTFGCSPSQFFVTIPMTPVTITCTDDAAPTMTVAYPPSGAVFASGDIVLRGTFAEAGAGFTSLEWSFDNASFAPVSGAVGDSFNWTLPQAALADGAYTLYLRATDRVSNVGRISHGLFTVDTVAPTLALGATPTLINRTTLDVAGTSEPFSTVTVRFSYGWNRTVVINASGTFLIQAPVIEGQNIFTVSVVDRAGNAGSATFVMGVDTIPPPLAAQLDGRPEVSLVTARPILNISGSCESGLGVEVNGAPVAHGGVTFEVSVPLVAGANHIVATCVDAAGNVALWSADAFFDDVPPELTVGLEGISPTAGGQYIVGISVVPISGRASDSGAGLAAFAVNGVSYPVALDGTVTLSVAIVEGDNVLHVIAVDAAGNTADSTIRVRRDTTQPQLKAEWVADTSRLVSLSGVLSTKGASAMLRLTLSEAARVQVSGQPHDLPAGVTDLQYDLVAGQNRVTIDYNDTAGNRGLTVVVAITRDSDAPTISVMAPLPDAEIGENSVRITGKTEGGATVRILGLAVTASSNGDFQLTVPLVEGANTLTIEAEDAIGNLASTTLTVSYEAPPPPPTAGSGSGLEIPLLGAGIAVGAAIGAALSLRRRGPPPATEVTSSSARSEAADEGPQSPPAAAKGQGPQRGPRGPHQP